MIERETGSMKLRAVESHRHDNRSLVTFSRATVASPPGHTANAASNPRSRHRYIGSDARSLGRTEDGYRYDEHGE
jgi:hypothetical protein